MLTRRQLVLAVLAFPALAWPRGAHAAQPLAFEDLYIKDTVFSDKATALDGQAVEIGGFMAPPLKAEAAFFVLTRMPMATCPFCADAGDWPEDIVTVYSRDRVTVVPFTAAIAVSGVLRLGTHKDEELGFVSRIRLTDATFRRL